MTIVLGNEGMQTPQAVAEALQAVAKTLAEAYASSHDDLGAVVRDVNGNAVGGWTYEVRP